MTNGTKSRNHSTSLLCPKYVHPCCGIYVQVLYFHLGGKKLDFLSIIRRHCIRENEQSSNVSSLANTITYSKMSAEKHRKDYSKKKKTLMGQSHEIIPPRYCVQSTFTPAGEFTYKYCIFISEKRNSIFSRLFVGIV
jgi:hypothetical protein